MENDFNFDSVGKRMPYTVPDGFFARMEEKLMAEVREQGRMRRKRARMASVIKKSFLAAAACAAIAFTVHLGLAAPWQEVNEQDVEQAFSQLSQTDQAYILAVYQDDVFLEE